MEIWKSGADYAPFVVKAEARLNRHLETFQDTRRERFDIVMTALEVAMLKHLVRTDATSEEADAVLDQNVRDVYACRDAFGLPPG